MVPNKRTGDRHKDKDARRAYMRAYMAAKRDAAKGKNCEQLIYFQVLLRHKSLKLHGISA